ncbi:hypothetical protein CNECB9_3560008 [Cupriavidus necator]|uniref:Uncharacterized protein n=1 Tax=Cupriavidus necator TaxID=106590 RepID=A0A1K0II07_CUPNE|nr:hypothetical protein CNECB9_3560008 [Cupriavidus necator]
MGVEIPDPGAGQGHRQGTAGRAQGSHRRRGLQLQRAVDGRHRHLCLGHRRRPADGLLGAAPAQGVLANDQAGALLAPDHLRDVRRRLPDPLLGPGCHAGPGLRPHRRVLSAVRHHAGLAGRGADRFGHGLERAVRRPAEDHGGAAGPVAGADGLGQQLGRRDGQDDRCAVHRGGLDRHQVVRPRGRHPALRVRPLDRAGDPGGPVRDAAGLCAAVHAYGDSLNPTNPKEESGFGCTKAAGASLSKVFSLSPQGERVGVRGGLARSHIKRSQRF